MPFTRNYRDREGRKHGVPSSGELHQFKARFESIVCVPVLKLKRTRPQKPSVRMKVAKLPSSLLTSYKLALRSALQRGLGGNGLPLNRDVLWYKDAIIYQVHVRTFHDSNGDGIGDFQGLEEKLDYLQELRISAIWLMPFFPARGRIRHFRLQRSPFKLRNLEGFSEVSAVGPRPGYPGHHRNGVEPHIRSTPV